jgi:hypothetical protein
VSEKSETKIRYRLWHLEQLWLLKLWPNLGGFWIKIGIQFWTLNWLEFDGISEFWFKPLLLIDDYGTITHDYTMGMLHLVSRATSPIFTWGFIITCKHCNCHLFLALCLSLWLSFVSSLLCVCHPHVHQPTQKETKPQLFFAMFLDYHIIKDCHDVFSP